MGVIEDSRKVLQDFLAPELRAISVRLDALEKRFDKLEGNIEKQFASVDRQFANVDQKFTDSECRAEKRHDELLSAIRQLSELNSVKERLARLESRDALHQ